MSACGDEIFKHLKQLKPCGCAVLQDKIKVIQFEGEAFRAMSKMTSQEIQIYLSCNTFRCHRKKNGVIIVYRCANHNDDHKDTIKFIQ